MDDLDGTIDDESLSIDSNAMEAKLAELRSLIEPLKRLGITREYLEQHETEDNTLFLGRKKFNEKARKNPDIMTKWIAFKLISTIDNLDKVIDIPRLHAILAMLNNFLNVLDAN